MNHKIIDRISKKIGVPNIIDNLVDHLSFGELQSLLLRVFELKSKKITCHDILEKYKSNRFVKPSDINPTLQRKLELKFFSLLPKDFEIIDLSPLTPLGTSSVLTTTHQNNVISTIRNIEVAADTTNILALECAKRREELLKIDNKCLSTIKICSSQRLTRAQDIEIKNFSAHFNLIALCSSGRDEGNEIFELRSLKEHIVFYIKLINNILDESSIKTINVKFFDYKKVDNSRLLNAIRNELSGFEDVNIKIIKNSDFGENYYGRLRFMISIIDRNNQEFDFIDGGFTNWTAKLLNNNKERLLTSGIGSDYLLRTMKIKLQPTNERH